MAGVSGPSSSRPPSPTYKLSKGKGKWEKARLSKAQQDKLDKVRKSLGDSVSVVEVGKIQDSEFKELFQGWDRISWDEDVGEVARKSLGLSETPKLTPIQLVINEIVETEAVFAEAIVPLGVVYKLHRSEVNEMMKSFGVSEQETAQLLGHVTEAAVQIRTMQAGLERVKNLSDEGREAEALEALASIINENYPDYIEALKEGVVAFELVTEKIAGSIKTEVSSKLNALLLKYGFEIPGHSVDIAGRLIQVAQRPPRWELFLRDLANKTPQNGKALKKACELVVEKNVELNDYTRTVGVSVDLVLSGVFKPAQMTGFEELKMGPFQEKTLKAFNRLHNEYEKEIKAIYVKNLELKRETDPTQKQILHKELRKYLESRIPTLNKLGRKFRELEGLGTLRSLVGIAEQLKSKEGLTFEQKGDLDNLVIKLNNVVKTFEMRTRWIDRVFVDLHLAMPVDSEVVEKVLLKGPIGTDPEWKKTLESQGLSFGDLRRFHTHFSRLMGALRPFYLAIKILGEDPENPELKVAFERARVKQIPLFNKSVDAIKKWGDLSKIKRLDIAIDQYRENLTRQISTASPSKKAEITHKLDILQNMKFAEQVVESQKFVGMNLT